LVSAVSLQAAHSSLFNKTSILPLAGSTNGTYFLVSCIEGHQLFLNIMGILEMMPPQQKPKKNHEGLNQLRQDGGRTTPMVFVAKQCCINTAVCQYTVMVNQPDQVPLPFWMF